MSIKRVVSAVIVAVFLSASGVYATFPRFTVTPWVFDPAKSNLVASGWSAGVGCATKQAFDDVTYGPGLPPSPFMEPACPTGDIWDKLNEGLGLVKTGPTYNNASAGATVNGAYGIYVGELGYDLRKPVGINPITLLPDPNPNDPRGSHCGGGSPRFNVVTRPTPTYPGGLFFAIACNSPVATTVTGGAGGGFIRLRWGNGTVGSIVAYPFDFAANAWSSVPIALTDKVKSIDIVMDEGQDTGPDNFGLAILDNIDINKVLIGRAYSW